ncbi:hypothetical protein FNF29_04054 [Cafeteria roenbergensis]|uniref:Uncharacterized protein n=1 Tax=Cafeteria roenbergensis TaxID=33653 RepID=A0A5A8CH80_CAFRO|nr:hypothetical protein FNF29_04054 [Cafeteria roenbergensis]|eukprot:KAA0152188.1 hypothetical protein FNF29_04054 [Cafeteria roenbergensis]
MLQGSTEQLRLQAVLEETRAELERAQAYAAEADRHAVTMTNQLAQAHSDFARELRGREQQQEEVVLALERHFAARIARLHAAVVAADEGTELPSPMGDPTAGGAAGGLWPATPGTSASSLGGSAARVAGQADMVVEAASDVFGRLAAAMEEHAAEHAKWEEERMALQTEAKAAKDAATRSGEEAEAAKAAAAAEADEAKAAFTRELEGLRRQLTAAREREAAAEGRAKEAQSLAELAEARAREAEAEATAAGSRAADAGKRSQAAERRIRAIEDAAVAGSSLSEALHAAARDAPAIDQEESKDGETADQAAAAGGSAGASGGAESDPVVALVAARELLAKARAEAARERESAAAALKRASAAEERARAGKAEASAALSAAHRDHAREVAALHAHADVAAAAHRDEMTAVQASLARSRALVATLTEEARAEARKSANEATYLRSQWEEEVACRRKLEEALEEAHQRVAEERAGREEARRAFRQREEEAKDEAEAAADEARAALSEAEAGLAAASGEASHLRARVEELEAAVERAEVTRQADEDEAARLRAAVATMEEALGAATSEAKAVRSAASSAEERHTESLERAKAAVDEALRRSEAKVGRLQEELEGSRAELADVKAAAARTSATEGRRRTAATRKLGAERLWRSLDRWSATRRRHALRSWLEATHSSLAEDMAGAAAAAAAQATREEEEARRERAVAATAERIEAAAALARGKLEAELRGRLAAVQGMAAEDVAASVRRAATMEAARIEVAREQLTAVFGEEALAMRDAFDASRAAAEARHEEELTAERSQREAEAKAAAALLEKERARLEQEREAAVSRALAEVEEAHAEATASMIESMQEQMESTVAELLRQQERAKEEAVAASVAEWEAHLREATDDWAERYDAMEAKLEGQLAVESADKEEWRAECVKTRKTVEGFRKAAGAWRLWLAAVAARAVSQRRELGRRIRAAEEQAAALTRRSEEAEAEVAYLEGTFVARSLELEEMRAGMRTTLTASKREQLMTHKVEATRLQGQLARLEEEERELEGEAEEMERWVTKHEEHVRGKELELREASEQSNITADGRVDMAVARRKRRLHSEHTSSVARLAEAKGRAEAVRRKQEELEERRSAVQRDMQASERSLTTLLMEQQRGLLAILKAAGEPAFDPSERDPRKGLLFSQQRHPQQGRLLADGSLDPAAEGTWEISVAAPLGHLRLREPGMSHLLEHAILDELAFQAGGAASVAATTAATTTFTVLCTDGVLSTSGFVQGLAICGGYGVKDIARGAAKRMTAALSAEVADLDAEVEEMERDPMQGPLLRMARALASAAGAPADSALSRLGMGTTASLRAALEAMSRAPALGQGGATASAETGAAADSNGAAAPSEPSARGDAAAEAELAERLRRTSGRRTKSRAAKQEEQMAQATAVVAVPPADEAEALLQAVVREALFGPNAHWCVAVRAPSEDQLRGSDESDDGGDSGRVAPAAADAGAGGGNDSDPGDSAPGTRRIIDVTPDSEGSATEPTEADEDLPLRIFREEATAARQSLAAMLQANGPPGTFLPAAVAKPLSSVGGGRSHWDMAFWATASIDPSNKDAVAAVAASGAPSAAAGAGAPGDAGRLDWPACTGLLPGRAIFSPRPAEPGDATASEASSAGGANSPAVVTVAGWVPSRLSNSQSGLRESRDLAQSWLQSLALVLPAAGGPVGAAMTGPAGAEAAGVVTGAGAAAAASAGGRSVGLRVGAASSVVAMPVRAPGPGWLVTVTFEASEGAAAEAAACGGGSDAGAAAEAAIVAEAAHAAKAWFEAAAEQRLPLALTAAAAHGARQGFATGFRWAGTETSGEVAGEEVAYALAATGWGDAGADDAEERAFAQSIATIGGTACASSVPLAGAVAEAAAVAEMLGAPAGSLPHWLQSEDFDMTRGEGAPERAQASVAKSAEALSAALRDVATAFADPKTVTVHVER